MFTLLGVALELMFSANTFAQALLSMRTITTDKESVAV